MTDSEAAVQLDIARDIPSALQKYESIIDTGMATLDVYLNCALIYFECQDHGFWTHYVRHTALTHTDFAAAFRTILAAASERFPHAVEPIFWIQYEALIYGDGIFTREDALKLVTIDPAALDPYMMIWSHGENLRRHEHDRYLPFVRRLHERFLAQPTVRNTYIVSIIAPNSHQALYR